MKVDKTFAVAIFAGYVFWAAILWAGHYGWPTSWFEDFSQPELHGWENIPTDLHLNDVEITDGKARFTLPAGIMTQHSPIPSDSVGSYLADEPYSYAVVAYVDTVEESQPEYGDHFGVFTRVHPYFDSKDLSRIGVCLGTGAPCSPLPGQPEVGKAAFMQFTSPESDTHEMSCFTLAEDIQWGTPTPYVLALRESADGMELNTVWQAEVYRSGSSLVLIGEGEIEPPAYSFTPGLPTSRIMVGGGFGPQLLMDVDRVLTTYYRFDE